MTKRRTVLGLFGSAAMAVGLALPAHAAEFNFNLQSFLPAQATIPKQIIDVWADKIEAASGDRVEITRYASMQLGGKPPELIDQIIDGIVDITWTVVGYTPGRFPSTEVFELPFAMSNAEATSRAVWNYAEANMMDKDFKDL